MGAAFDAFKIKDSDETDKQGLVNALRIVFYNLSKDEIEKIVADIYAETEKNEEENVNVLEAFEYFEKHPEITNEKKQELEESSSASLPPPFLNDTQQPMFDDCISYPQNTEIGTPYQSQFAVQQGLPMTGMTMPLSQELIAPSQQEQSIVVVNHYIQERLNKDKDENIGKFGVASRNILVDNPKLETALSQFLANKEVCGKELFCKKIGGINYCTTLAATCEQIPSLICTLFEKFAEAKKEYIEIESMFLDKNIKNKGRYTESIRHDQQAVEQAATAFHTSPTALRSSFRFILLTESSSANFLKRQKLTMRHETTL